MRSLYLVTVLLVSAFGCLDVVAQDFVLDESSYKFRSVNAKQEVQLKVVFISDLPRVKVLGPGISSIFFEGIEHDPRVNEWRLESIALFYPDQYLSRLELSQEQEEELEALRGRLFKEVVDNVRNHLSDSEDQIDEVAMKQICQSIDSSQQSIEALAFQVLQKSQKEEYVSSKFASMFHRSPRKCLWNCKEYLGIQLSEMTMQKLEIIESNSLEEIYNMKNTYEQDVHNCFQLGLNEIKNVLLPEQASALDEVFQERRIDLDSLNFNIRRTYEIRAADWFFPETRRDPEPVRSSKIHD